MSEKPSLAEIFAYEPDAINFNGFTREARIFHNLRHFLGRETILKDLGRVERSRKIVEPSFPLEYVEERQRFFQRLEGEKDIQKRFFDRGLPKSDDLRQYASTKKF